MARTLRTCNRRAQRQQRPVWRFRKEIRASLTSALLRLLQTQGPIQFDGDGYQTFKWAIERHFRALERNA